MEPNPVPVASVVVSPVSLALAPGDAGGLTAEPRAADGTPLPGRPVTWTSADPAVATVSAQGAVSALTVGSTTVTATTEGKTGSAEVVVAYPPATTVVVLPATLSLQPGQTGQFTAEARNPAGNAIPGKTFTWAVGTPLVATISQTGQVSALIPGTTTVTASVDGKLGSATLTVVPGPVATVEVAPSASTVEVTKAVQLVATAKDDGGFVVPDQPVAWVTSVPSIATVSNSGLVTGVAPGGPVTVTAAVAGKTGAASITVVPGPVANVAVTPAASTLQVGQTLQLAAAARDAQGNAVTGRPVTWTGTAPATASVSPTGLVTALVAGGPVSITATIDGVTGNAAITVVPVPVARVEVTPWSATLLVNATVQLTATAKAADGSVLTGRVVQWTSSNPAVATVTPTGLVTGVSLGSATIAAAVDSRQGSASLTVVGPRAVGVEAWGGHTCAVLVSGSAYCWGRNDRGQLGDGSLTVQAAPVQVAGGVTFTAVSAGSDHTCGLSLAGSLHCWGWNAWGEVGDGSTTQRNTPVPVGVGPAFRATSVGQFYSCGLDHAGRAYCWGLNNLGQLGDGTGLNQSTPVAVAGGYAFASMDAGAWHACGATPVGAAYCWGLNGFGELGNGSLSDSPVPVLVAGAHSFRSVSAGATHTCGVTTGGAARCWGNNESGQLGDGSTSGRVSSPGLVLGGYTFRTVSAGNHHTCGVTESGAAFCWGDNQSGQLGDGSTTGRSAPVAVLGGLLFQAVSAGGAHTCGLTAGGDVYCWGAGGLLGDGTYVLRTSPVIVVNLTR